MEKDLYNVFLKGAIKIVKQRNKLGFDSKQEQRTYNDGFSDAINELQEILKKANSIK